MKRIPYKDGTLYVPEDWVQISFDDPEKSSWPVVMELHNGKHFCAPLILFFSTKPPEYLSEEEMLHIRQRCIEADIRIAQAMEHEVIRINNCFFSLSGEPISWQEWYFCGVEMGFFTLPVILGEPYGCFVEET